MNSWGKRLLVLVGILWSLPAASVTNYFVVADPTHRAPGSYVLPLTNATDIAHARKLIEQGPAAGGSIVVAAISGGFDCINRDYEAAGTPPWSWHVKQFCGFADFTIELCDGTPTMVEQDVNGWIENTGGVICFWRYTVVRELNLSPPALAPPPPISSVTVTNGSVHLSITNLFAPWVCSIERNSDLPVSTCGNLWRTVGSFPVTGPSANWIESVPPGTPQAFYRLRIDCPR